MGSDGSDIRVFGISYFRLELRPSRLRDMKTCGYCGRKNSDEDSHCCECGTDLAQAPDSEDSPQPRELTWPEWLGPAFRLVTSVLLAVLLYLLSFGPVERFCGTVLSKPLTPVTFTAGGQTIVRTTMRTVAFPRWVMVIYRPALMVSGSSIYRRYLEWWEAR
jgi:hypothetical protein